jgi:hypothetical protein
LNIIKTDRDFDDATERLSPEQRTQVIEALQIELLRMIRDEKGNNSLQDTIRILLQETRNPNSRWQSQQPYIVPTIQSLAEGVDALSRYCTADAIEHFLEAILSQDPKSIHSSFLALPKSLNFGISVYYGFFPKSNPENEIRAIIRDKFPNFCNKHIQYINALPASPKPG